MRTTSMGVLVTCLLGALVIGCDGSRILGIFPMPSKSHYILGEALFRGLAQRGHDVTMISPYKLDKPIKNYREIYIPGMTELKDQHSKRFTSTDTGIIEKMSMAVDLLSTLFHMAHNNSEVQKFIARGEKFDACIVSIMMGESLLGICKEVHAVPVAFSLVGMNSIISYHSGNPVPYSYVPTVFASLTDRMTFMERVQNTVMWILWDGIMKFMVVPYQAYVTRLYYPNVPELKELLNDVDLFLLNSHISTDTPKPLLPNVVPIGGFHLQIMDELPKDIKDYLDKSKKGVIYFSMGSNSRGADLDPKIIDSLVKAFAKIDYDVLWKFEDELPNKPKNVKIAKWLPQRPILMHPNVKIFMTHGGLGGTVESIFGAVPMICMPMFGDQGKNCAESEANGYAVTVELKSITEEKLLAAIKEITQNPSYKHKIDLKSDLYKNQEVNPMDKAIFWIEHAIRHKGAKHLKSQAPNIPWCQYYLLDVIAFLGGIAILALLVLYFVTKLSLKMLCWTFGKITGRKCKKDNKVKIN